MTELLTPWHRRLFKILIPAVLVLSVLVYGGLFLLADHVGVF